MTKEEKKVIYQTIVLLETIKDETKKDYLKEEAERLILELKKSV